jgi:hypothetical protein
VGLLGVASIVTTAGLYRAVHDGPYRLAVDPFDTRAWLFRASGHVFPDYRAWTVETSLLTAVWLTILVVVTAGFVHAEHGWTPATAIAALSRPRRTIETVLTRLRAAASTS